MRRTHTEDVVFLSFLLLFADLTGLWYGPPPPEAGNKRDVYLALRTEGKKLAGEIETPTRHSPLSEIRVLPDGFRAVAAHDWDGKPVRRPVEARLENGTLHLRVQAWPDGPMQSFALHRVSENAVLPSVPKLPLPPLEELQSGNLARTPPMGWNSWNKFGCRVDDKMIRDMADALVSSGMRDAGYVYVNIDDCWQSERRDANGDLQADPRRFPDMKALADYVHERGLRLGIYSSPGPRTCAGFEGSYGHEQQDARQYAAWGIDYLKYDWCGAGKVYTAEEMRPVYQKMGKALQASGRPIVFSICQYGLAEVWKWGRLAGGNLWRTTSDIGDNWKSVEDIGFRQQSGLAPFAGPGGWNDPDMLEVGNGGMTAVEYRTHFTLWSMLAAPLLAGNDIRNMSESTRAILLNREVIAVNQDRAGKQGSRVWKGGDAEIWSKPLHDGSTAVAVFNRGRSSQAVSAAWSDLGLTQPKSSRDLWLGREIPSGNVLKTEVAGHGVVLLRVR